jgi:hypothetical protein
MFELNLVGLVSCYGIILQCSLAHHLLVLVASTLLHMQH